MRSLLIRLALNPLGRPRLGIGRPVLCVLGTQLLLGPSCTYISRTAYEDKLASIDEDLDGSPRVEDCDDLDPDRSPDFAEVAYDGIDNDCKDGDALDLDGDGYPGITDADYALLEPDEPMPAVLMGKPRDCVDDPTLRPDASAINPGAGEIAYDGIDADCDGSNDFDQDEDGYLPDTVLLQGTLIEILPAFDAFVAEWAYEDRVAGWAAAGNLRPEVGDCDDFDASVHPNPGEIDVFYDGIDLDCDGTNDFDIDGDGFMPPVLPDLRDTRAAYNDYIAAYYDSVPPWVLPDDVIAGDGTILDAFSDCLDEVNPAIVAVGETAPVDPATVYPQEDTVNDRWYDGIDTNCWADNDFDRDNDGFIPTTIDDGGDIIDVEPLYDDYVSLWGYQAREPVWGAPNLAPSPGDCEDGDSETYPEALELVGDGADQDCDGLPDAARFTFASWVWDRPSAPRVTRIGDIFVVAATARSVNTGGGVVLDEVGLALSFPLDQARTGAVPVYQQFKNADVTRPVDEVIDVALVPTATDLSGDGIPDSAAWFGTTFTADANGYTYLHGRQLYEHSASGAMAVGILVSNYRTTSYAPTSLEISVNTLGEPYVMACTNDFLHVIQGLEALPTDPELEDTAPGMGGLCYFGGRPYASGPDEIVDFTRCNVTQCRDYALARSTVLTTGGGLLTGEQWTQGHQHGDVQVLVNGVDLEVFDLITSTTTLLFDNRGVTSADAVLVGADLYAVAIVNDGGGPEVKLAYGIPPAMNELSLPFIADTVPDAVPRSVGLHVDGDRVLVVVSARDRFGSPGQDAVGWMFLGTPQ